MSSTTQRSHFISDDFIKFCRDYVDSTEGKNSSVWKLENEKDGVSVYTRQIEESTTTGSSTQLAFRISGIVKATAEEAFEASRNVHFKAIQKNAVEEAKILVDHHTDPTDPYDLVYQRTPSPNTYLVAKREFFTARFFDKRDGRYQIYERSIDPESIPSVGRKALQTIGGVREAGNIVAQISFQIIEFEQVTETTAKFEVMSRMSMGGWIPAYLIAAVMKIAPQKARDEMESCIKLYRESKK